MKRRPSGSMSINKAIVGFVNHKLAEGLTDRSVSSYERILTASVACASSWMCNELSFK